MIAYECFKLEVEGKHVFCLFDDTMINRWIKVGLPPIPNWGDSTTGNEVDWECEQFSFCKAASTQNGIFNGKASVDILISKVWSLLDDVLERRNKTKLQKKIGEKSK